MNQGETEDDRRARLRDIDASLERLRSDLPAPSGEPADLVDSGQYLAQREELQGQIDLLEAERERLRDDLGMT